MLNIVSARQAPHLLDQLSQWFQKQWGGTDPLFGNYPDPLLALDADGELVAGLSFTRAPKPGGCDAGVWINALVVAKELRRQGIASSLINNAVQRCWLSSDLQELFVYTDLPQLYEHNGWLRVSDDGLNSVLTIGRPHTNE